MKEICISVWFRPLATEKNLMLPPPPASLGVVATTARGQRGTRPGGPEGGVPGRRRRGIRANLIMTRVSKEIKPLLPHV